jgi:hypothetical protein
VRAARRPPAVADEASEGVRDEPWPYERLGAGDRNVAREADGVAKAGPHVHLCAAPTS